ncbi:sirohydrochlorin ferrochelatase [Variovorax boronicumulans]|uniref:hypothetical protein n=1 Tax=Variovorax boronicumulans TaxID=436515 RepID=UPI0027866122|nr:hypothetical protein [Variovorax boronicumulans]MDP9912765.1 sirohydrochlorin ferrochelatase [Variovorax boronicumulans]
MIGYFINEALYRDPGKLTDRAQGVLDSLGETGDAIVDQLRVSSLENTHEIATKFNHNVKIHYRPSVKQQIQIAIFDAESAKVLQAELSHEQFDISAVITRLNIHTGNGRLQIKDEGETVAFGFGTNYKEIAVEAKKIFSANLDYNNGISQEKWSYLRIAVSPFKLRDGRIVKYIVRAFYEK